MVHEVIEDSPAAEAGLQQYDIIKEIDEKSIKNIDEISNIIDNNGIGETIMIKIIRDGSSEILFAEIGKKPADLANEF
jgi:serine protease Do